MSLTPAQLAALLAPLGEIARTTPLTGGMFATTTAVTLTDGARVIVKASPTDVRRLCRYEYGIAASEALVYGMLAGHAPVPEVLSTDFTRSIVDADIVVTRHLPGRVWNDLDLDAAATARARHALGALMAELHRVPAPAFGYPAPETGMRRGDWRSAVIAMFDGILQDAAESGTTLPARRVRDMLARHGHVLDAVTAPVVVHNDLWPANIFLDDDLRIVGLIDTERTVWGDPLLDLVGANQMSEAGAEEQIIAGNVEAGGVLADELASPTGPLRLALYRLYYTLILATEIDIRGFEGDGIPEYRASVAGLLGDALEQLEAAEPVGAL
ncbi:phosphotransferase family protein [Microbacterium binotii]|uniref:phosphotransferase family protein n=1 Tax=Microbacterium binotii TaxID=462710 RepID=UPI001F40A1AB|nr:phosphotransferase [Microbacterium binotii]UIN32224.1 phosphotransferase [Microbacterium binotii]